MTDITPPSELVQQWMEEADTFRYFVNEVQQYIAARAAHWGYDQRGEVNEAKLQQARDQELEACCEWLGTQWLGARTEGFPDELRAARRPKPPSLKEQALALLDPSNTYGSITQEEEYRISVANAEIIRRALEALPDD